MSSAKTNKKMSPRRRARAAAVQSLYQLELKQHTVSDVCAHTLEYYADESQKIDDDYFVVLVNGVMEHIGNIDKLMAVKLDRDSSLLTPVELAVLRLAVFELKYRLDVPSPVVINEALELAKSFGTDDGYKYINGVLDALLPSLRS